MRKLKRPMQGIVHVLLGVGFIWCLTYIILSNTDEGGGLVTSHDTVTPHRRVKADTSRDKDIMRFIAKFADDLLNIVASSDNFSAPSPLKDYKGELHVLQIKLEAEEEKAQMRDEMIKELRSDKLHLQEQVVHLEELLKMKTGEDAQSDDQDNCPLPPMDEHPECTGKLKWMKKMWESDSCYRSYGVNGSLCSFLIYLSEIESWCPVLPGRTASSPVVENLEEPSDQAVIQKSLKGLYSSTKNRIQFRWIHGRIQSMEKIWIQAGQSLSAKYSLTGRKAKQILVHPGAVTDESGFRIAESAFSGGPLGELVQWSDLISTLYILGHRLHLSASVPDLKHLLGLSADACPPRQSAVKADLIYTDIIGLKQIQSALDTSWTKYNIKVLWHMDAACGSVGCMIRVLDTFGTEPDFNHAAWAEEHHLKTHPWGGLNLIPMQFYTMFPHTPDNTFLGFVVQHQLSSDEARRLQSVKRQNRALVYGKRATFWEGKRSYLDTIHKRLEVHGTVDDSYRVPEYVVNHGIVKGTEVQTLLRQSKVFVGLSFPYEGPAPLEALANGCVFLNPRLDPPQSRLNSLFFSDKPTMREVTSQHPYAEAIGEPYVWMVDMNNLTDVERALTGILSQKIEPYIPYEFTCEGMLQRVNALIEKQDFCDAARRWPPRSALQVVKAEVGTSCKQACQDAGLICEPAFFPDLNSVISLASYGVDCQTSQFSDSSLVLPAHDKQRHCLLQADPLLFSCVRSAASLNRVCPCRDYIKDQRALCKACV